MAHGQQHGFDTVADRPAVYDQGDSPGGRTGGKVVMPVIAMFWVFVVAVNNMRAHIQTS